MKAIKIFSLILLFQLSAVWAAPLKIMVVGLFSGQAVVQVNGKQHLLKAGKTSPEGVKLISATSQKAVLEIDGVRKEYLLGRQVGGTFSPPPEQPMVSIWPTNGMYRTPGSINGFSIDFLVDTGASTIAMNASTAARVGLDYTKGRLVRVSTASDIEVAYEVSLDNVQVGDITLHNVRALVMDGAQPSEVLLGMSFLGQLDMHRTDERLDLKKKY